MDRHSTAMPDSGAPRSPAARRKCIADYVLTYDAVSAKELAARFGVSVMTIHRDLDELERQSVLRKFRGGVTPQPSNLFESNVRYRHTVATTQKEALARFAITLIERGQAILLDDSTTVFALARLLPSVAPITAITNFRATINELSGREGVRLIALGGEYLERHDTFAGLVCETAIASLRADLFFLSTSAVSGGFAFHQEQEIVSIKRAMMAVSTRRVLLVTHQKFGRVALHRLAPLRDFDEVVVDDGIEDEELSELRETRARVVLVPVADPTGVVQRAGGKR